MNKILDLVQLVAKNSDVRVEYVKNVEAEMRGAAPVTEVRMDMTRWYDYLVTKKLKTIKLVPDYKSRYFRAVASIDFQDGSSENLTLNSQEHTHEFILLMETLQVKELGMSADKIVQVSLNKTAAEAMG